MSASHIGTDPIDSTHLPAPLEEFANSIDWLPAADTDKYRLDPRDRFVGKSAPVFLPRSTKEVSELVALCHRHQINIVPYGGGTGVVAGQLVFKAENTIIISLEKMNAVRSVCAEDSVLIAEAGCILAHIQEIAAEIGMIFPLSMASEGSSTIGGNLATNCGGIQVLRYGNARDLCLGIEAVLPDGSILHELTPLRKNNTGYDLRHLLIGSEGTLGIITAASLSLKPTDAETLTAFCSVNSPASAVKLLSTMRSALGDTVSAFELMCDYGFTLLEYHFPEQRFPLETRSEWYVLMEVGGTEGLEVRFQAALEDALETELISDAVVASSQAQRNALWRLREDTPEANRLSGAICNSDTSVPLSEIQMFIESTYEAISDIDPTLTINCYGHVGDGNIHFNVFPPPGRNKAEIVKNDQALLDSLRNAINQNTLNYNGSISAEHGIGRLKQKDLSQLGNPAKLSLIKTIKQAIDPKGIMNPGVIVSQ
ncbi:MAG: FAD-binding oxidoreductase [Pseudomonadota bacterium]